MARLSEEIRKVARETNDIVIDGLKSGRTSRASKPSIGIPIARLDGVSEDFLKNTLGESGRRLLRFANRINYDHPDLDQWLEEVDQTSLSLFANVSDILTKAQYNKDTGQNANLEARFLAENPAFPYIIQRLERPKARLLRSTRERVENRGIKKSAKNISLKQMYSQGENGFYNQPEHFKRYARCSKYYIQELHELEERQAAFNEHGMPELAHAFVKRMRELEEGMRDTIGFFCLKPDEAAITLARLHNLRWNDSQNVIAISGKFFDDYVFWSEEKPLSAEQLAEEMREAKTAESMKKSMLISTRFAASPFSLLSFAYQPRLYPLPSFSADLPPSATRILESVERCSDLGGVPFFDYYWVLVPSISLNHPIINKKGTWTIRDGNQNYVFQDQIEAAAKLDTQLTREGFIIPIIIGERDGHCYFLCCWT